MANDKPWTKIEHDLFMEFRDTLENGWEAYAESMNTAARERSLDCQEFTPSIVRNYYMRHDDKIEPLIRQILPTLSATWSCSEFADKMNLALRAAGISGVTFDHLTIRARYIDYYGYDAFNTKEKSPGERLFASRRYLTMDEMI